MGLNDYTVYDNNDLKINKKLVVYALPYEYIKNPKFVYVAGDWALSFDKTYFSKTILKGLILPRSLGKNPKKIIKYAVGVYITNMRMFSFMDYGYPTPQMHKKLQKGLLHND